MSSDHLWVYGTLRRGCANPYADLLSRSARYLGLARVQARLYRVSWYPGIRLGGDPTDWVVGDLFRILRPDTLPMLDAYEGPNEYRRMHAIAVLEDGRQVRTWIYEYLGSVNESRRIASGDWLKLNAKIESPRP